jgi:hypothetical protein
MTTKSFYKQLVYQNNLQIESLPAYSEDNLQRLNEDTENDFHPANEIHFNAVQLRILSDLFSWGPLRSIPNNPLCSHRGLYAMHFSLETCQGYCRFTGGGTVFVEALQKRTSSSFGSLQINDSSQVFGNRRMRVSIDSITISSYSIRFQHQRTV